MTTTQPLEADVTTRGDAAADKVSATAVPAKRRLIPGPLLPARMRPLTRPLILLEIALIGISYYLYTLTRLAAPGHKVGAEHRGWAILNAEHYLGINFEHTVNHWVWSQRWLAFSMNLYYGTVHFIVPIVVLIWVYVKFPDRYRTIRTVMFAMTGLALIGFYFYSLCPPRLMPDGGFIDTFRLLNPWGSTAAATSDGPAGLTATNEYAAMPSLHIGWSTWCALAIAHLAERRWVKALGIVYPFVTFAVIIGTANHYVLDAAGGLLVLGLGFLVQRVLQGRPTFAAAVAGGAGGTAALPKQATDPAADDSELVRSGIHTGA